MGRGPRLLRELVATHAVTWSICARLPYGTGLYDAAMRTRAVGIAILFVVASAPLAHAEPAVGLLTNNQIATFDTATPGVITLRAVSGLQSVSEHIVGLDLRPATGNVYLVSVPVGVVANALVRTYVLDVTTGAATIVGAIPNTVPGAADVVSSMDFNPVVDRIRFVNVNDENFRINPNSGTLSADDPNLNPAGTQIIAEAYDRNVPGPPGSPPGKTTLYGISRATSSLVTQGGVDGAASGGANGGAIVTVGALGVTLDPGADGGLDISPTTGIAYATLRTAGVSRLYTISLTTGAATVVVGAFLVEVVDLAILPPPAPPPDTIAPQGLVDAPATVKRKVVRTGLTVGLSCDEACHATVQLAVKATVVASGEAALVAAGVATVTLTPTEAGAKLLRRKRGSLKAELSVSVTDPAGNASVLMRPLVVRR